MPTTWGEAPSHLSRKLPWDRDNPKCFSQSPGWKNPDFTRGRKTSISAELSLRLYPLVRLWGSMEPQARPAHLPRYQLLHQTPTQRELLFSDGGFKGHHWYLVTQIRPCWGQGSLPGGGLGHRGCLANMTWLLGPSSMLWSICPFSPFPKL